MASNVSSTSLCNRALLAIGGKSQISNLDENSTQAAACKTLYVPVYEQLARSAWWNCFRAQVTLSLLAAAEGTPENPDGTALPVPPSPWLYQYAFPDNCLKARAIVPTFPFQGTGGGGIPITPVNNSAPVWIRGMGQIPFAVAYSVDTKNNPRVVILTNQSQAQLIFTVDQPNPVVWDSQFQQAFVASLAAYLVPALNMHIALMQIQVKIAEGIIMQARASDGNEGSNTQDHEPDWMRARSGGGPCSYTWGAATGWDEMSWPGMV